jgi:hypothetical protein
MTPETVTEKANRLLLERKVFVRICMPEHVVATVRGTTGLYDVDLSRGRWRCGCAAFHGCSHIAAVQAVTLPPAVHDRLNQLTTKELAP